MCYQNQVRSQRKLFNNQILILYQHAFDVVAHFSKNLFQP